MSTVKSQFAVRRTLSAEQSRSLVDAAAAGARSAGIAVTVVVVDDAGVTKEMLRMDGAPLDTIRTATNKAYAAASLGIPSDDFFKEVESEPAALHEFCTRDDLSLIGGGVPVLADGEVAGAIGISGADTGEDDRSIAESAIASAIG